MNIASNSIFVKTSPFIFCFSILSPLPLPLSPHYPLLLTPSLPSTPLFPHGGNIQEFVISIRVMLLEDIGVKFLMEAGGFKDKISQRRFNCNA